MDCFKDSGTNGHIPESRLPEGTAVTDHFGNLASWAGDR